MKSGRCSPTQRLHKAPAHTWATQPSNRASCAFVMLVGTVPQNHDVPSSTSFSGVDSGTDCLASTMQRLKKGTTASPWQVAQCLIWYSRFRSLSIGHAGKSRPRRWHGKGSVHLGASKAQSPKAASHDMVSVRCPLVGVPMPVQPKRAGLLSVRRSMKRRQHFNPPRTAHRLSKGGTRRHRHRRGNGRSQARDFQITRPIWVVGTMLQFSGAGV